MKLVLIGIPGAGKSTQGNLLSKQLKIPYLSTGHIFREIAKDKTQLGRYVKEVLNSGLLIPDNKTIEIVNSYLSRPEYKNGYILDGFPRTLTQAKKFINNVDKVIYLEIPDKEALWRLAYRNDVTRNDDTVQAIRKRIEIFHKYTKPVIHYYEKKAQLIVLDGTRNIKEINKDILRALGKQLIKNQIKAWELKKKSIIAITGLPGSGKSEAAQFFKSKGLPVISFSDSLNEYIDKNKLKHTEETHKQLREGWRKEYGNEAFARMNENKLKKALEDNMIVVIQGLRSWEEYVYLKKIFPKLRLYILAMFADRRVRYSRIAKRSYRSALFGEERDINEILGTNLGPTIAAADFLVKNNYSLQDLQDKLEEVYRSIYYA